MDFKSETVRPIRLAVVIYGVYFDSIRRYLMAFTFLSCPGLPRPLSRTIIVKISDVRRTWSARTT